MNLENNSYMCWKEEQYTEWFQVLQLSNWEGKVITGYEGEIYRLSEFEVRIV